MKAEKKKQPATVEKLLYSRRDAAFALSFSLRKIDYLIAQKELTTKRIGGSVRIPKSDVLRVARCGTMNPSEDR